MGGVAIRFRSTEFQKSGKFEVGGYLLNPSKPPTKEPQKSWHSVIDLRIETEYQVVLVSETGHQPQERLVT